VFSVGFVFESILDLRRRGFCGRQIGGHVTVTYAVGGANMSIGEPLRLAADGEYHVVRFARYGANATLQLDDLPTQTRNYSGQLSRPGPP